MANRHRLARRTVLRTIGALSLGTTAASTATASPNPAPSDTCTDPNTSATVRRHVATVDRIVDGRHVVLLLEADGRVVDQLVVPVAAFDDVSEGDILIVVVTDEELLAYRSIPDRPPAETVGRSLPSPNRGCER